MSHEPYYSPISPVSAGLAGKCPRCGRGRLFSGYLTVAPKCNVCNLDFNFADAGDGAAWFVMLVVGFLAIGVALWIELTWQPAYWVHALAVFPIAVILPIVLLRPIKGILICQQYSTRASEGRTDDTGSGGPSPE